MGNHQKSKMNVFSWGVICLFAVLMLNSCKPDLVVDEVRVNWNDTEKKVEADVSNRGNRRATNVLVYFTPNECPVSQNYRPQTTHTIPQLNVNQTVTLESDFLPLARPENANLANVRYIVVTADPKDTINEKREDNNERTGSLHDLSGLTIHTYNEGLASVLRGLRIDPGQPVNTLHVAQGYYRIRQFRVLGQPTEKVIALCIRKNYAEMASGGSILPKRDEEWVFSIIEQDVYNSSGWTFKGHDFHNHTLSFRIEFRSTCNTVEHVKLDCVDVMLSTQTYTTAQLNTCGWTSEPPWTTI